MPTFMLEYFVPHICSPSCEHYIGPVEYKWWPDYSGWPTTMPMGWQCPKCKKIYAPTVTQCYECNGTGLGPTFTDPVGGGTGRIDIGSDSGSSCGDESSPIKGPEYHSDSK